MKNKVWLLSGIGFALVAALIGWACISEYGTGYSEDQRRNWNEMLSEQEGSLHYASLIANGFAPCEALAKRQSQADAPKWSPLFLEESIVLPPEGMSFLELINSAENGDGDACLELVFRYFRGPWRQRSQGQVFLAEKYLKKAVAIGRPGADFLLRFFEDWKKYGYDVQGESVGGYQAFLSHLDDGDFFLGKVYFSLSSEQGAGLDRLVAGLDRKAACGDIVALRNRGYLELLKKTTREGVDWIVAMIELNADDFQWIYNILMDASNAIHFLPECLYPKEETIKEIQNDLCSLISSWYFSRNKSRMKEPLRLLMEAAERGDLHAKYLWNQYFVWSSMKFSKKDWESHLRYTAELVKAGWYYPGQDVLDIFSSAFPVELVFYEKGSVEKLISFVKQRQEKKSAVFFPQAEGDFEILKMNVEAKYDMGYFVYNYMVDLLEEGMEKTKMREEGLQLIEQAAEEGDPNALYGLAGLLHEGMIAEQNVQRSWELLQRLKTWRKEIGCEEGLVGTVIPCLNKVEDISSGEYFDDALEYQILNVVSRNGDMPGMTVKEAFDRFVEGESFIFPVPRNIADQLSEQFEKRGFKELENKVLQNQDAK